MFNLSFGEILIIGTVGILVIGPKRLPEAARFIGHLSGRIQRQVTTVKADIKREMALEDMKSIHRQYEEAAEDARQTIQSVNRAGDELRRDIESPEQNTAAEDATAPPPAPLPAADKENPA